MPSHARFTVDADVTPRFTACYLRIAGDECAFVEAHTSHALPRLLAALAANGMRPEQVRWIVITHAHLDHAAGASALMAACPNAVLLAHPRAARHMVHPEKLVASATAVYGEARFRALYGAIEPIPQARVRALADGEGFALGDATLTVFHTAGHANHHFVVDDPALDTVYTGDTFGLVYPALQGEGRFAMPSTSPTNFDAALARQSIDKVLALGRAAVALTHFDAYEDAAAIATQVVRFIDRAGRWVDEAARGSETVPAMTARLARAWEAAITEEAPSFGEAEKKFLAFDVDLNAQGLAFVADAKRSAGTRGPK
jgi:glyoxylase-like metal-dependent hydrolase (beta-lactamase superfamily II)